MSEIREQTYTSPNGRRMLTFSFFDTTFHISHAYWTKNKKAIVGDMEFTLTPEEALRTAQLIHDKYGVVRESAEPALKDHERYVYDDAKPLPRCCDTCQSGPGGDNYDECPDCKDAGLSAYRPIKPAVERGPEVDALLWMAEHVMGADAARTMRGWLDRFRAEGRLVVLDAAGAKMAQYPEEVAR